MKMEDSCVLGCDAVSLGHILEVHHWEKLKTQQVKVDWISDILLQAQIQMEWWWRWDEIDVCVWT